VVGGIAGIALIIGAVIFLLKKRGRSDTNEPKSIPSELDSIPRHEMKNMEQEPVKYAID
jgi:hypothetical protein